MRGVIKRGITMRRNGSLRSWNYLQWILRKRAVQVQIVKDVKGEGKVLKPPSKSVQEVEKNSRCPLRGMEWRKKAKLKIARRRRVGLLLCSLFSITVGFGMALEAFIRMRAGDFLARENYKFLPISPLTQFILCSVMFLVGIFQLWNLCRTNPESGKSSDEDSN